MKKAVELRQMLQVLDHKGYPAYKTLKGSYSFEGYTLDIIHIQSDPFAPPSRIRIVVEGERAGFPIEYFQERHCRIALQDYLTRTLYKKIEKYTGKASGSGKSGMISVSRCQQEILERSALSISPSDGKITAMISVGFPARGRTITSDKLIQILFEYLPVCITGSLCYKSHSSAAVRKVYELAQDQQYIREHLDEHGLCGFVANGSILPRKSGISSLPMKEAISFVSPKSMEVTFQLPYKGKISGMGIKKGITLIVGGGYHGKSTLLEALERGVYNHIAGDGREFVIMDDTACKIRSEDGRSIRNTDISMFINHLPNRVDTTRFSTEDASGSTSQVANVVESMESGSRVFLIDEDTSATNFMIRDELMQRVVSREKEPITPFIERARFLYETCGISSVIVAGSSGEYFYIADTVLQMDHYMPREITELAKKEAEAFPSVIKKLPDPQVPDFMRIPSCNIAMKKEERLKAKARGISDVSLGHENIELRYLEQLIDPEQAKALSAILLLAEKRLIDGKKTIRELADEILKNAETKGLVSLCLSESSMFDLAMPRRQEIHACLNRYRGLKM